MLSIDSPGPAITLCNVAISQYPYNKFDYTVRIPDPQRNLPHSIPIPRPNNTVTLPPAVVFSNSAFPAKHIPRNTKRNSFTLYALNPLHYQSIHHSADLEVVPRLRWLLLPRRRLRHELKVQRVEPVIPRFRRLCSHVSTHIHTPHKCHCPSCKCKLTPPYRIVQVQRRHVRRRVNRDHVLHRHWRRRHALAGRYAAGPR